MQTHQRQGADSALKAAFADTILGLYLGQFAARILPLGTCQTFPPEHRLDPFFEGCLCVVLSGVLTGCDDWHGPGNHFIADGTPLSTARHPVTLWILQRDSADWRRPGREILDLALHEALNAAQAALDAVTPIIPLRQVETVCDTDHPTIRRQATRLLRTTEASTAEAIFRFVQAMPYRFGVLQERASTTLARGTGMCTTKANLQAALMRAAGLEAGFVEMAMPLEVLRILMPEAAVALMRPSIRHYFGAVRLGGRWHCADSSYDDTSLRLYLREGPEYSHLMPAFLEEGRPYSPTHCYQKSDPFTVSVRPDLHAEMAKKARFSPRHFEALNTRLDRETGAWRKWLGQRHPETGTPVSLVARDQSA